MTAGTLPGARRAAFCAVWPERRGHGMGLRRNCEGAGVLKMGRLGIGSRSGIGGACKIGNGGTMIGIVGRIGWGLEGF